MSTYVDVVAVTSIFRTTVGVVVTPVVGVIVVREVGVLVLVTVVDFLIKELQ